MGVDEIDYINTHGTSTPIGDPQEIKAIQSLFGDHAYKLNISSTKSMHGHLLGGTGAVEAIASIMAIKEGIIPPTINHFTDDEELDAGLNFTFNTAQRRAVTASLTNTFGFGGHNCTLIFRKFEL
jgi:3-oxoacyl-[acyl-carrier-protein] synthase II